jgi:hypothetical protein
MIYLRISPKPSCSDKAMACLCRRQKKYTVIEVDDGVLPGFLEPLDSRWINNKQETHFILTVWVAMVNGHFANISCGIYSLTCRTFVILMEIFSGNQTIGSNQIVLRCVVILASRFLRNAAEGCCSPH